MPSSSSGRNRLLEGDGDLASLGADEVVGAVAASVAVDTGLGGAGDADTVQTVSLWVFCIVC